MVLVALTALREGAPLDAEVAIVSELCGVGAYETRQRLLSPPPALLGRGLPIEIARRWLGVLRARGHGAIAADEQTLPRTEGVVQACELELAQDHLVAIDRLGQRFGLPHAELLAIVLALYQREDLQRSEQVQRKFAYGRAALTGGLMRSKEVRSAHTELLVEHERVLLLFRRGGPDPMVLREHTLRYGGMGAERGRTERESFERLQAWLRSSAPTAIYDERLSIRKRRPVLTPPPGQAGAQPASVDPITLAAFLLVHAHLQGQLPR